MREKRDVSGSDVEWKEWSEESFEEARRQKKLVLLDLTASWCHWCHVMDKKTYSNPEIAAEINEEFIPIRVDIDRRPDISERYNRGGFPTTAFLSDRGESIWGATFVPPLDMKRIMEAILNAKGSGEIDRALERSRIESSCETDTSHQREPVGTDTLFDVFENMLAVYDTEFGGFGVEPKFPHPDLTELLLTRYTEINEGLLLEAAVNSLKCMASGLRDKVEGGVFRYSVTRDWRTPHYEKMLETNVNFLRNLIHASAVVGDPEFDSHARDTAKYLLTVLYDPDGGGFFGSQDADEEYYRLNQSARRARTAPSIDRTVYAGWNAEASATFVLAGTVLRDEHMIRVAESSFGYMLDNLWNPSLGLVRHVASEETYLFEDQVSFLRALLAQLGLSKDDSKITLAEELLRGVDKAFANPNDGYNDVVRTEKAIGALETPIRPLVENSNWALELARLGAAVHREELTEKARNILNSFSISEIEARGVFAAAYLRARWALDRGLRVVEIHTTRDTKASRSALLATALKFPDPAVVPFSIVDDDAVGPYSLICTEKGCSRKLSDPENLRSSLSNTRW
jgi:uncharacterized protein YyaL (SSP411 family)